MERRSRSLKAGEAVLALLVVGAVSPTAPAWGVAAESVLRPPGPRRVAARKPSHSAAEMPALYPRRSTGTDHQREVCNVLFTF
jgi:hypothetical protein